jgi:hypothetical protein
VIFSKVLTLRVEFGLPYTSLVEAWNIPHFKRFAKPNMLMAP